MSRRLAIRLVVAISIIVPLGYLLSTSPHPLSHYRRSSAIARSLLSGHAGAGQGLDAEQLSFGSGLSGSSAAALLDLDVDSIPVTKYEGGLAGYTVWSNLYLSSGAFLALRPTSLSPSLKPGAQVNSTDDTWPHVKQILSSEKRGEGAGEDRWRIVDYDQEERGDGTDRRAILEGELGKRVLILPGVTYVFNDIPGPAGYLVYFRHFLTEVFLGGARAMAAFTTPSTSVVPQRIWFPRCGANPSWRDDKRDNAWFFAHAMPLTLVEDALGFEDRASSGLTILLEKVVIVDRWAAHSNGGEVGRWNKMNTLVPTLPAPHGFWEPFRLNLQSTLGLDGPSRIGKLGLPVVVYVDRQRDKPKVSPSDHAALVKGLKGLTHLAEIHVTRLSGMTRPEQIELLSRAEIILGIHSDDLMGAIWMRSTKRSAVIELYEEGGFVRDWQLLGNGLGHQYIAIQGDKVLTEEDWRAYGGSKRGKESDTEIKVHADTVVGVLRGALQA